MSNSINGLGFPQPPAAPNPSPGGPGVQSSADMPRFETLLMRSLNQADALQQQAQAAVEKGLAGGDITQVEMLTSMKKADLALKLMVQIRNKIFDAYTEIQQLRM
jgi:flagellar hook-basal body complex protein FliE